MNSLIILQLLLLLLSSSLYTTDNKLKICNFNIPNIKTNKLCNIERIKKAGKRHQFLLFNLNEMYITFHLYCPICLNERINLFEWYYIPHYKHSILFIKSNKTLYESDIMLNNKLLKKLKQDTFNNLCINKLNLQLIGQNINANKYLGTYVCQYRKDKMHPSNFIWYHLYKIGSLKQYSKLINLSNIQQIYQLNNQINIIFKRDEEENKVRNDCDKIQFNHPYRRCYLKIPRFELEFKEMIKYHDNNNTTITTTTNSNNNNNNSNDYEMIEIIKILRLSFEYFTKLYDSKLNGSKQLAINKAKRLGFKLYIDNYFIYIPCEYELLQHIWITINDKFLLTSKYKEIHNEIICNPIYSIIQWINLNKQINQMNKTKTFLIKTIQQNSYHLIMKYDSNIIKQLKCINLMNSNIFWLLLNNNNHNYTINKEKINLPDIRNNCNLKFGIVLNTNNGTYDCCHGRNSTFNLMMMMMINKGNNIIIGIIILTIWLLISIIIWVLFLCCINYMNKTLS
ncbi:unnamed protein product [Schistosoma margrebowiei]|uniref:Ig-like domain-containing protein n=1 Tax=Schistosoma margrebowiei TaxID=48269 RepID=A0AA84ZCR0_9TREM|nr:unnamed protein product [Schistosoma margrebowiei]